MNRSLSATDRRKSALRDSARVVRAQARSRSGETVFEKAARNFLDAVDVASGQIIAGYWPIGDEFDPRPLLAQIAARGGNIALPVVTGAGEQLGFRSWRPGEPLKRAKFGTYEPAAGAETGTPALLIVPLLAFDRRGGRLGYGGGYYDRTLAVLRHTQRFKLAIGIGFSAQQVARVPTTANDQALDAVVTEDAIIWTGKRPAGSR